MVKVDARKSGRFSVVVKELHWRFAMKKAAVEKNPLRPAGTVVDFSHGGMSIVTKEDHVEKDDDMYLKYITREDEKSIALARVVMVNDQGDGSKRVGMEFIRTGRHFLPGLVAEYFFTKNRRLIRYTILLLIIFCAIFFFLGRISV